MALQGDLDLTELIAFTARWAEANTKVVKEARKATKDSVNEVAKKMRADVRGIRSAPGFPASITSEMVSEGDAYGGIIGPRRGGVGSLALLYFGNSKSAPVADIMAPITAEAPILESYLLAIATNGLP